MASKRHSILPSAVQRGPKPPAKLSTSLVISDRAILVGTHSIVIMSESVVHPLCRLESMTGSILVGRRCIIQERCHIGAQPAEIETARNGDVSLGDYVTVEASAIIEAGPTEIGEDTTIGIGSRIGCGAKVGKSCTIAPKSVVRPGEVIPDFTIIYANNTRRVDRRGGADGRHKAQVRQIEVLRRLIPSNPSKFQD